MSASFNEVECESVCVRECVCVCVNMHVYGLSGTHFNIINTAYARGSFHLIIMMIKIMAR